MRKTVGYFAIVLITSVLMIASCKTNQEGWYEKETGRTRHDSSRFYNPKYSSFSVKPGDILVYSTSKGNTSSDLIITVTRMDSAIGFNYSLTQEGKSGSVSLSVDAVKNAIKYDTLPDNVKEFTDRSFFWLSKRNYGELKSVKESVMDFGDDKETFARGDNSTMKIKIKGREKVITLYNVKNKGDKAGKTLTVLTDDNNPLIVKMNAGWSFSLKEVR